MSKELKSALFAVLLIAVSYYFGSVCERVGQSYALILSPSRQILGLAIRFLLAVGAVALTAGLVAALVRPLWACFLIFALSALAMLLGWELAASSGALTAAYFIASLFYAQGIAGELDNRLSFSVRPIWHVQPILLMALVIVACGSFYFGYAAEINREGFSIPPFLVEMVMGKVEEEVTKVLPEVGGEAAIAMFREQLEEALEEMGKEVGRLLPEAIRDASMAKFRGQLERALDEVEREAGKRLQAADKEAIMARFREQFEEALTELVKEAIRPYERWIPLVFAISIFVSLVTITRLLSWIPILALRGIFPLLTALGVTKIVIETRQVKRLTLG
ncbi:MAG: hypothetical protein FJ014_17075 [Chloroflexi bacterium]|nr:hypothetical protein [Chloroflexota bacterium]